MPFSINQAFGIFPQAMQLEARRAQLLASNIANADTPNYKARDINFKAALHNAMGQGTQLPLATPNARDIQAPSAQAGSPPVLYQVPLQPALDGNTVNLQHNQAAFGENALRYEATVAFLGDRITNLRKALTGQ